jgi:hypothetical protein
MKKSTAFAVMLLAASGFAGAAQAKDRGDGDWKFRWHERAAVTTHAAVTTVAAPEIDPASVVAGITLLCGGLAILRGRRSKEPSTESDEG